MGTYTTNYNLFMPTVGEQGWGDLVNGNFSTIDNTMKGLSNNIGTLETETDAIEERVTTSEEKITVLEAGKFESITADLSPCFNLNSESNVISFLKVSFSQTLASGRHSTSTSTHTYKSNPFNNTFTFSVKAYSSSSDSSRSYISINGTIIVDTGVVSGYRESIVKNETVTLNDGDTIYAYAKDDSGGSDATATIGATGWITN